MLRLLLQCCLLVAVVCVSVSANCTYKNPLFPYAAPDPWVTSHNGFYYYSISADHGIQIYKSAKLSDWSKKVVKTVWRPPPNKSYSKEIWAPEIHRIGNRWYIYFAADDGQNKNHRMFVLESKTEDALGEYVFKGQLKPKDDMWAIDGTVFSHNKKLYFVWSGWPKLNSGFPQNLYIAEMESPTKIRSNRVLLATPTFAWEKKAAALLEGPEALINPKNGKVFITYSGSGSWTRWYAIGTLELRGQNPMDPKAWHHHPNPLFIENDKNKVYGVGHASFTTSKDGKEHYILYHGMSKPDAGWAGRTARLQKFRFDDKTGYPVFGAPEPINKVFPAPAGDC